jgi:hypothetical protein
VNTHVLAALKTKRAALAGEIALLKRTLKTRQTQLEHLDAAFRLFDPSVDPDKIPARRTYKRVNLFKQGALSRQVTDILRRAGKPLSAPEIVSGVMAALGHGEEARRTLAPRVRSSLAYLAGKGSVKRDGKNWKLDFQTNAAEDSDVFN